MRIICLILIFLESVCFANEANKINLDFFNRFNDSYLPLYINKALSNNHTLKQANHKVNQYRAEIMKRISYELPELSTMPSYLGVHFPKNDYNIFVKNNAFILPLKVSFEPDFLLKNYDKIKKSKTDYKAQIAKTNNIYITLVGDVASTYVNILLYDYLIKVQEKIIDNNLEILSKENLKFDYGLNDVKDINRIKDDVKNDEIKYNELIKTRNTALYNLCKLTGESADNFKEISRGDIENLEYTETIPEIISSDLIYLRPDMIEAENKLKSAKIDITIAKKEFFPKFDITGFLVFDTLGLGNFFSWSSSFAFLLAGATQDIFQGGRKIANLKLKKEKFNELMEEYKEKDLVAIKEVNNALNLIKQDKTIENNSKERYELEKNNLNIADKKYKKGVSSKLDFLNSENYFMERQKELFTNKTARIVDYITLYKALGGNLP